MDFARQQRDPTRHLIGIAFVVLIHALVIWALFTGLGQKMIQVVKLDIDDTSRVYWNGEIVPERAELEAKISAAAHQAVQPEVHLRPDKSAKYAVVAGVMASAQRLGLTKIGIVGSEQFIDQ